MLITILLGAAQTLYAQDEQPLPRVPAGDTIHLSQATIDSLERADSLYLTSELHSKQIANMRHFDLLRDGKPVTLRIESLIVRKTDNVLLHFTIKGPTGKLLWDERWKAEGYFDPQDHLDDSTKLKRLRYIIHRFFANENFTIVDSATLSTLFTDAHPLDIPPDSPAMSELATKGSVMYNVFRSREFFYGLTWLPDEKKFARLWRN